MCGRLLQLLCSCLLPWAAFCKSVSTPSVLCISLVGFVRWSWSALQGEPAPAIKESSVSPPVQVYDHHWCQFKSPTCQDNTVDFWQTGAGESGPSTNQPPALKLSPGEEAAILYSLFLHLVPQSAHLIKPKMSFLPVGSAAVHLSQST